uniref:Guanine nucleotide exchange factor n=1 Tax=Anopheles merus TaxID=30066 RepID=A0A182UN66_ANOME
MDSSIITVQAQYSFKGSNNDELCFKKGDIITLTQREEGGWWEGTLGDKTGWFPSNYVKEYVGPLPLSETIRPPEEIQAFRSVVFRDLLESEKAHVAELRGLSENFLEPLEGSQILSSNEYTQLMCNFLEVVEMHEEFLQSLEDCNDRVGKVFLSNAPTMKKIHQFYCAAHPRAIVIVDKFRDELNVFMEKQGAAKPGLLVLTTGLSKPFRRLDKYAAILQELERHMESGHPDRGDTQRSIAVYKDIASSCSATRRQKELELQILTGPVRGWQGAELSTLGDIIHMGSVAVGPEHKDRYLVLFPQTLLILSVSQRMSAFKYEGKLPLTGITVNRLEDTDQLKNAFEISGTLIDRIVAVCQGPNEANRWVELLSPKSGTAEQGNTGAVDMKRNVSSSAVNIPQPPPHVNEADSASEDGDYDNDDNRSSEMIGSAAIPFLRLNDRESLNSGGAHGSARSNAGRSSGIHTSTARLLLGELKLQCSEQSQVSSFEHRDAHGRMACENLLNLDESMQIKHSLQQKTITEERHSMPTYFVGNRFNNSSVTEIYIPSWKEDCQVADAQGTTAGTSNGAGNTDRNSVHSSSLDIPAIVPAPDPVTAELLYNFPTSTASGHDGADDRQIRDNIVLGCLSREQSPFRKHSINSDKKLVLNPNHHRKDKDDSQDTSRTPETRLDKKATEPSTSTARRCLSYQYVQLSSKPLSPAAAQNLDSNNNLSGEDRGRYDKSDSRGQNDSDHISDGYRTTGPGGSDHKCRFCSFYSRGHSPHSSDSEQRTLLDENVPSAHSNIAHGMLHDREPPEDVVDGVPSRSFSLRQSRSSHNLGRFALVGESEFDFTDSGQYDHHNDQHAHDTSQPRGETRQDLEKNSATVAGGDGASVEVEQSAAALSEPRRLSALHDHSGHDRVVRSRSEDRVFSLFSSMDREGDAAAEPRLYSGRSRIVVNLYDRSSAAMQRGLMQSAVPPSGGESAQDRITYKTGLYAHWWKKEKLPIFVATSNESLKLPPASGPLSRPMAPRSPCIGDSSNSSSTNSSKPTTSQAGMSTPSATGNSHPSRSGTSSIVQHMSQHKRSQSFNHHLSYNQVQQQQQQQQQQLQQQQLKQHQQNPNLSASPNSLNLNRLEANQAALNQKGFSEKANWNITNLRPAPPLRPAFLSSVAVSGTGSAGGGTGGGRSATASITGSIGGAAASCVGGGSSGGGSTILNTSDSVHHSLSFSSSSKVSPTYEEDALVLRVIEAYCAAYQSTSRHTMHSALLPWTPCLPIRGGKLKTSKHFSSSNPQLPFTCSSLSSYLPSGGGIKNSRTHTSTNSINSSHIWREASPNSFNLYAASIATLSMPSGVQQPQSQQHLQQQQPKQQQHHQRARYSIGGYGSTEWRSHSEESGRNANGGPRSINTLKTGPQAATGYHNPIARSGSNYDNIFMNTNTNTPLLSRVSKQQTVWMNANQLPGGGSLNLATYQHQHHHHQSPPQHHHRHRHRTTSRELDAVIPDRDTSPPPPAPEGGGYIGGEYLPLGHPSTGTSGSLYDRRLNRSFETAQGLKRNSKISQLRRSTPQLNGDDGGEHEDAEARGSLLQEDNLRDDMSRNSVSCCNKLWMFYWQHHR